MIEAHASVQRGRFRESVFVALELRQRGQGMGEQQRHAAPSVHVRRQLQVACRVVGATEGRGQAAQPVRDRSVTSGADALDADEGLVGQQLVVDRVGERGVIELGGAQRQPAHRAEPLSVSREQRQVGGRRAW